MSTLRLAICDDEPAFREAAVQHASRYLAAHHLHAEIAAFSSGHALLSAHAAQPFDLFLLDVLMPDLDGIALARKLRSTSVDTALHPPAEDCCEAGAMRGAASTGNSLSSNAPSSTDAPIVFLTTSHDYAVAAFALHAVHYLVKPFTASAFDDALTRALAALPKPPAPALILRTEKGTRQVRIGDILYSETFLHYQHIRLASGETLVTRMSGADFLSAVSSDSIPSSDMRREAVASSSFVRAGLRVVINLAQVLSVDSHSVQFTGNISLPIPRRTIPLIRAAHLRYLCR